MISWHKSQMHQVGGWRIARSPDAQLTTLRARGLTPTIARMRSPKEGASFVLFAALIVNSACAGEGQDGAEKVEGAPAQSSGGDEDPGDLILADDPSEQAAFTLRPKMTISSIVLERYGSRHYSRAVILHNKIHDPSSLPVGKVIKTPDLAELLKAEPGLFRRAKDEVEELLEIRRAFMAIEGELGALAEAAPDAMQFKVPAPLGATLRVLAGRLEAVGESLAKERPDTKKSPTMMIGSILEAATICERLAAGEMMDEKFHVGQIHKRLGNAFADAMIWARVERG